MYVNREWESQQGNASGDGRQMHTSPGKLPGDGSVGRLTSRTVLVHLSPSTHVN